MGATESSLQEKCELKIGESIPTTTGVYKIWTNVAPCVKLIHMNKNVKKHSSLLFVRNFSETDSEETINFFQNGIQVSLFEIILLTCTF